MNQVKVKVNAMKNRPCAFPQPDFLHFPSISTFVLVLSSTFVSVLSCFLGVAYA
jgi:hypothetical protein